MAYQLMVDLLKKNHYKWLALAAPQVGCPQRFFVSDLLLNRPSDYEAFINPEVEVAVGSETIYSMEKCVSIPHTEVNVPRHSKIDLHYTTLYGEKRHILLEGMQARVAQHEVDHLNGIVITNYEDNRTKVEMPSNELGS